MKSHVMAEIVSDALFNREPMKLNKHRNDMFTSTAKVNEPCSTIKDTLQT